METGLQRRAVLRGAGLTLMGFGLIAARPPLTIPNGLSALPEEWLNAERIGLWQGEPPGGGFRPQPRFHGAPETFISNIARPELHVFSPKNSNRRALLVIPGGAYRFVSVLNEGVDIARVYTRMGYTVFVLTYRLPGEGWKHRADVPLQDAQRAMRLIRSMANARGYVNETVSVIGFSAGGHLAASLMTDHAERVYESEDDADQLSARPACGGLIYPVIALEAPHWHKLSAETLLGQNPDAALIRHRSPACHVTADTPATFLVHAADDPAVPWQNSQLMLDALTKAGRSVEFHLFEEGGHGFGTGPANAPAGAWTTLHGQWLDRQLWPRI